MGGDWWNRCHGGTWARDAAAAARDGTGASWLNIDEAFSSEKMGSLTANQIATDDKGGHNMMVAFRADTRLPFLSNSVQLIYTEHMLEHLIPMQGGVAFVRELYRLLVLTCGRRRACGGTATFCGRTATALRPTGRTSSETSTSPTRAS